jgi:hypothetical protein
MATQKCKICKKAIIGTVKIETTRKKLGNKIIDVVEYYDEKCFKQQKEKRASNGRSNKKRTS